ncbi:MAG: aminoacyl-histidine dipeptidase [Clostridia bacterium]|nr:aminoacyl-histidine dipeptidase [Clostridia bacterium]
MDYILENLEPKAVFKYFEEISRIPRGSGNETAVVDYIAAVASSYGLEYRRDAADNILVRRKADKGREAAPCVILQGHTDMVCQCNADTEHNFETDPLDLYIDNGFIRARGTTLGGDDGIACAYMLALLTSEGLELPEIECLFTSGEEVGMTGAIAFDYSDVKSRFMINIDSEDEGICVVSCAGGVRAELSFTSDAIEEKNKLMRIEIKGLCGGHSGVDINIGHENAILLMAQLLDRMYAYEPFNLVSFNGGTKDNAIPRESVAVIASPDPEIYKEIISEFIKEIKKILSKDEKAFKVHTSKNRHIGNMFTFADTSRVISAVLTAPNGVIRMSQHIDGLVETSSNTGVISAENGSFKSVHLIRSSSEYSIDSAVSRLTRIAKLCSCDIVTKDRYPGWEYKADSKLRDMYVEHFKLLYGYAPKTEAIHAGLECGLISSKLPGIDIISIGPDLHDIHSPDERMDIASVERTWKLICRILKTIA